MTNISPASLSNTDLLTATTRAAADERCATTRLLALLAEVDARQLYLTLGGDCTSLFAYATRRLHLSESAAYSRITAARLARRFPMALSLVDEGALSLTTAGLLAPHLTDENHSALFDAARHKSRRDVERLVAALHPQPDIPSSVRALPASRIAPRPAASPIGCEAPGALTSGLDTSNSEQAPRSPAPAPAETARPATPPRPALVAPLAPGRYLIRMTISEATNQKLERARCLLRHVVPDGDPAAIVDRALTVLLQQEERRQSGAAVRPRAAGTAVRSTAARSRHVPADVRRAVWTRDGGRCAFFGSDGRCAETGGLEVHHAVPFAVGGPTTVQNLELRCRAHNAFEGREMFGDWRLRARARSEAHDGSSVRTEQQNPSG